MKLLKVDSDQIKGLLFYQEVFMLALNKIVLFGQGIKAQILTF